jgi:hypothetical protein
MFKKNRFRVGRIRRIGGSAAGWCPLLEESLHGELDVLVACEGFKSLLLGEAHVQ